MKGIDDLFAQLYAVQDSMGQPQQGIGPVQCTRTLALLPLRYAAVGGSPALRSQLPDLPAHLRPPAGFPELGQASYALRTLREGFLYVLVKRASQAGYAWEGQYQVNANGSLAHQSVGTRRHQPQPQPQPVSAFAASAGCLVRLIDPDDITDLRLLFSPDPLTELSLQRYRKLENVYRGSLTSIDPATFVGQACPAPQPGVLTYDQLELVADFAADRNPKVRALLNTQLFPSEQVLTLVGTRQAMAPKAGEQIPRGIAIVVNDAIGITQELNNWRNAAIEDVRTEWLSQPSDHGVDNEHALLVAQSFVEVERLYPELTAEKIVKSEVSAEYVRVMYPPSYESFALTDSAAEKADKHAASFKPGLDQFERDVRARVQARKDAGEFKQDFDKKYGPLINREAMQCQLAQFEAKLRFAQYAAEARAGDHARWAGSVSLLQALDAYDSTDLENGLDYAEQTGRCIVGMEAGEAGAALLDSWFKAPDALRSNLAIRGVAFNQEEIIGQVAALREAAKNTPETESPFDIPETLLRQAYAAANAFTRANDLHEQMQLKTPSANIGIHAWFAILGKTVLRNTAPSRTDRLLYRGLGAIFMASVHETAVNTRLAKAAQAGQALNPARVAGQVARYLNEGWADSLMQSGTSDFYKVRASTAILLLEVTLMAFKLRQLPDFKTREYLELSAAAFATASAGFELGATFAELQVTRFGVQQVTGEGAAIVMGRWKVWGAGLGGIGFGVMALLDIVDGINNIRDGKASDDTSQLWLGRAYAVRGLATMSMALAQSGSALAIAGPLLKELLARRGGQSAVLSGLVKASSFLATPAMRLLLVRIVMGMFWVSAALTFAIWLLDDDAMEKWCKRSTYRQYLDVDPHTSGKELPELFAALREII